MWGLGWRRQALKYILKGSVQLPDTLPGENSQLERKIRPHKVGSLEVSRILPSACPHCKPLLAELLPRRQTPQRKEHKCPLLHVTTSFSHRNSLSLHPFFSYKHRGSPSYNSDVPVYSLLPDILSYRIDLDSGCADDNTVKVIPSPCSWLG